MALLFAESFEGYGSTPGNEFDADFYTKWDIESALFTDAYAVATGRAGESSQTTKSNSFRLQSPVFPNTERITVGFAFKTEANTTAPVTVLILSDSASFSSIKSNLILNTSRQLQFRLGTSAPLSTGSTVLALDTWYYIEFRCFNNSSGSYEVRINGVTEFSGSGDTAYNGNNYVNRIRFWPNSQSSLSYDDIYVIDDQNGVNDDFLGDCQVSYLAPNGGDTSNWTPTPSGDNSVQVRENPPDGDASYVETSSASAQDFYQLTDLPELPGPVYGVQVEGHAKGASSSYKLALKLGNIGLSDEKSLTSSYQWDSYIWDYNPNTTSGWTRVEVNGAQPGIEQVSGTPRVTRLAANVVWQPIDAIVLSASSTLTLDDDIIVGGDRSVSIAHDLTIEQALDKESILNRSISDSLTLTSIGNPDRDLATALLVTQAATGVASKVLGNTLTLTDAAEIPPHAESSLSLTQSVDIPTPLTHLLTLTQSAVAVQPPATKLTRSTLTLTHSVQVQGSLSLSAVSNLSLNHGLAYIPNTLGCTWPGIDTPQGNRTKGILLVGDTTLDISRSMNIGDIDRLAFDRIVRETRGGTLHVYADPIWPKIETLLFSISAIRRDTAQALIAFIHAHLGRDIKLTTHEGRVWEGFITNPQTAVTEDRRDSFTVNLEFEGTLMDTQDIDSDLLQILISHGLYLGDSVKPLQSS